MRPSSFVVTGNARFTNKIIFSLLNALTRPECSSNLQMCTIRRFFMQSHVLSFSKNYSSSASIECACFLCDASFHISLYYLNYHISGFRRFCSVIVNTWNAHALQILTIGCILDNCISFHTMIRISTKSQFLAEIDHKKFFKKINARFRL